MLKMLAVGALWRKFTLTAAGVGTAVVIIGAS